MSEREKKMTQVLLWLDAKGGLGSDVHDRIKEALGLPNGKFCRYPAQCLVAGRCTSEIACND